jgi:selenium metabolism protein YedF
MKERLVKDEAKTVDARGLACPQPVILTRRALQESSAVLTIVDNATARYNVSRMAEKAGYAVQIEERDDGIYLHIGQQDATPAPGAAPAAEPASQRATGPLVLVVSSEHMGRGEHAELGQVLIRAFFHALGEVEPWPQTIIFFNSGVKLVAESSPVLEDLEALCSQGIEILACGTCLHYYHLQDKLAVGQVSNMYTIAETMLQADKVVNL